MAQTFLCPNGLDKDVLEQWKCNSCTFLNSMDAPKCAICDTGKKAKMSPTLENSVSMSPTLPVPSSNVDCHGSEKSDKCSVIELDTSSEEEESEKEESDEEYVEVDETIPTSTIQRQSKRLRTGNSVK